MFVRKKKYPSGNIGVIVAEKANGKMKELATIGVARGEEELASLVALAKVWISKEKARRHPRLASRSLSNPDRGRHVQAGQCS